MSSEVTKTMLNKYVETSPKSSFLASKFSNTTFHNTETVEIDVTRSNEDVAIVIQDLSVGSRSNSADLYTNKNFVPPIYSESFPINSFDAMKRVAGSNPFQDPNFQVNISNKFMDSMKKVQEKIMRSIELQASQILTTGKLTLGDASGTELYALDFKPKATHFPTAGTAWNAAGATIVEDLRSLCNVIRDDGKDNPNEIFMGEESFEVMISNSAIRERLDNRRIDVGDIGRMRQVASGGTYRGSLQIGNFTLEVWTYPGRYTHPSTGTSTNYVPDDKVIVRANGGRLDSSFGAIPRIVTPEQRVLPFLPAVVNSEINPASLSTFAWVTPNGMQLMGEVSSRPLLIPTAIDTFGCLDTNI